MTVRVAKLSGRLSRAFAVGRAGLSLTTQRLRPAEILLAEPSRKTERMQTSAKSRNITNAALWSKLGKNLASSGGVGSLGSPTPFGLSAWTGCVRNISIPEQTIDIRTGKS